MFQLEDGSNRLLAAAEQTRRQELQHALAIWSLAVLSAEQSPLFPGSVFHEVACFLLYGSTCCLNDCSCSIVTATAAQMIENKLEICVLSWNVRLISIAKITTAECQRVLVQHLCKTSFMYSEPCTVVIAAAPQFHKQARTQSRHTGS